jgi:hypothetical protein
VEGISQMTTDVILSQACNPLNCVGLPAFERVDPLIKEPFEPKLFIWIEWKSVTEIYMQPDGGATIVTAGGNTINVLRIEEGTRPLFPLSSDKEYLESMAVLR